MWFYGSKKQVIHISSVSIAFLSNMRYPTCIGHRAYLTFLRTPITPDIQYITIDDRNPNGLGGDGRGDSYYGNINVKSLFVQNESGGRETRATYEYNIGNLSLPANTVISHAIFNPEIETRTNTDTESYMSIFGYARNGIPDA